MFKKILVPLDGSPLAERALSPALALAKETDGEIVLLHALITDDILIPDYMGMPVLQPDYWIEERRGQAVAYLANIEKRFGHPNVKFLTSIIEGDPASLILDTAREESFDLIAMSTHGYSGVRRFMFGSVTEHVLRHSGCPILVVRQDRPISHILITVDGSPMSETVIEPSLALARLLGAKVTLLRVEKDLVIKDYEEIKKIEKLDPGLGERIMDSFYHRVDDYLNGLRMKYSSRGLEINVLAMKGDPADDILTAAAHFDTDLIAMATHGRTGLRRWVYGSVTEKVLRQAERNMLVVRPPDAMFNTEGS